MEAKFTRDCRHGHQTRRGEKARLLGATKDKSGNDISLVFAVEMGEDGEVILQTKRDGRYIYAVGNDGLDIVDIVPDRHYFINFYEESHKDGNIYAYGYGSEEKAEEATGSNQFFLTRIECVLKSDGTLFVRKLD